MLHLNISDLIQLMEKNIDLTTQLSIEREQGLVCDVKLLLMALLLMTKLQFEDIVSINDMTELEGIQPLARLDRMKLIELQPGNRVKLMLSSNLEWLSRGPIQPFLESRVQLELLESSFTRPEEFRVFVSGMISRSANAEIIRKMQHLAHEMHDINLESETLPLELRRVPDTREFV